MRAKNEYKFIEEAYTQVNEGFDDVGKGHVHRAAARGARPRNPDETALGKAFLASQTAEGPPNPGPDDLGPDKSEEQHETHKPYVSSYIPFHRDEDDKLKPSKKIWAVLDKRGNAIFTSNNKDEAYEWFDDNFERLRDEDDEYDEESYWTPELTDEDKIKDHGPVRQKDLLTPKEEKEIDEDRAKLHASKVKSSFGKKRWE
jgi:hypothetical protein